MAGIKDAREEYESEKTYLTNDELIEQETEFCVMSAQLTEGGQFGPTWTLMIVYLDESGEHVSQQLYLSAGTIRNGVYKENNYRRWFFTKKATYPIHHVVLTQGIAQNGRKFNDIADAESSTDPCPCMTGDLVLSLSDGLLSSSLRDEDDESITDAERGHYIEGIFQLSNKMGWPTDAEALEKKSNSELRKLYKNLGALALRQGAGSQK